MQKKKVSPKLHLKRKEYASKTNYSPCSNTGSVFQSLMVYLKKMDETRMPESEAIVVFLHFFLKYHRGRLPFVTNGNQNEQASKKRQPRALLVSFLILKRLNLQFEKLRERHKVVILKVWAQFEIK